jgi:hypothetical protein
LFQARDVGFQDEYPVSCLACPYTPIAAVITR